MFESRVIPSDLTVQILTADPPTLAIVGTIEVDLYAFLVDGVTVVGDFAAVLYSDIRRGMHILSFDLRSLPAQTVLAQLLRQPLPGVHCAPAEVTMDLRQLALLTKGFSDFCEAPSHSGN